MNDSVNHNQTTAISDGCNDPEQTEEERIFSTRSDIFADGITDEAMEAAASGPTVTLTLSVVLFACQFCPR
jgi:hypothetical protein